MVEHQYLIRCLAAAQHLGMAYINHWIRVGGERRLILQSLLLFPNTLYSNTHIRTHYMFDAL